MARLFGSPLLGSPNERTATAGRALVHSEVSPTRMTIAIVDEPKTRSRTAELVTRLAALAVDDELSVIHGSNAGVSSLVTRLRERLPRYTVVALHVLPSGLRRDADLIDELVDTGCLPFIVTPAETVTYVAAELRNRLRADRVVRIAANHAGDLDMELLWQRRHGARSIRVHCAA